MAESPGTKETGHGDDVATVVLSDASVPAAVRTPPHTGASLASQPATVAGTYHQVLELSERRHTRRFILLILALATVVGTLLWLLGGHPTAQLVAFGGILFGLVGVLYLYWLAGDERRYRDGPIVAAYVVCIVGVFAVIYFWGMFSAATSVAAMGCFFVGLGRSLRVAVACLVVAALIQAVVGALLIAGVLPDYGLIRADALTLGEQVVTLCAIESVYLVALLVARAVRSQLDAAVAQNEDAVRAVAKREALLEEARFELERARRVGGPGRYTEQTIGSFELGPLIGRGAMGEVYEATRVGGGDRAAVKVLGLAQMGDPAHLVRFYREARAAASLRSPHVVAILEVPDPSSPIPYLAMERLYGQDLGELLRARRRFDRAWAVELARETAAGLEAARAAGIVHRDIKPQNLFRARRDEGGARWKILDFGVSKIGDQQGTLTQGAVLGTPMYMAPEQARSQEVDHRADVYGLAAVLYRVLTGRPPFSGGDLPAVLHQVVYTAPERPGAVADLPEDVDRALALGLAKLPADRLDTAAELAAAIEQALRGELPEPLRARADALLTRHPYKGGAAASR